MGHQRKVIDLLQYCYDVFYISQYLALLVLQFLIKPMRNKLLCSLQRSVVTIYVDILYYLDICLLSSQLVSHHEEVISRMELLKVQYLYIWYYNVLASFAASDERSGLEHVSCYEYLIIELLMRVLL